MHTFPITINLEDNEGIFRNDFIPITRRYNSLSDLELNFIANTIKTQNLENQMNLKILGLKHKLNEVMALNS